MIVEKMRSCFLSHCNLSVLILCTFLLSEKNRYLLTYLLTYLLISIYAMIVLNNLVNTGQRMEQEKNIDIDER